MSGREQQGMLAATQRRLWQLIVAPTGVADALRATPLPALESIVRSDEALDAETRLSVYANAYFARILQCLENDFATLRAVLGEAPFRDLATSYLAVYPPEHFSLRYAGARLTDFLADHAAGEPFTRRWPFCADLARLEWARVDVFDERDSSVARRDSLADLRPERWADLVFELVPAFRMIHVAWPVHDLYSAHAAGTLGGEPVDFLAARTARLCAWRDCERVFHRELSAAEANALEAVGRGACFGELCQLAAQSVGDHDAPAEAAGWLARWLDGGLLSSARVAPEG